MPAVLARAGCPVGDNADVATLASDTVRWVRDVLPHLPPELLEVTLRDLIRKSPMVLADVRGLRLLGLGASATPVRIAA